MPDTWDFTDPSQPKTRRTHPVLLTWTMVGLCVTLTILYWTSAENSATRYLARVLTPTANTIWEGRYYSLFTTVFIHGNVLHIAFNMLWLLRLGSILEQTLNPLAWALFFIASAIVGSCSELALSGDTGIGASGVVYAMFGLLWAGRERFPSWQAIATRENLNYFVGWGVLCIILTYTKIMPIANGAHAGGFLFGIAVGWLFVAKRFRIASAGILAAMAALAVLSVTWMPWSARWTAWTAYRAFDKQQYRMAIDRFQRSMKLGLDPRIGWENITRAYIHLGDFPAAIDAQTHTRDAIRQYEVKQHADESADFIRRLGRP